MPMPDARIRQNDLEKILEHLFNQYYGRSLLSVSDAEKKAAIESVAKDVMESRNGSPIPPEEINQELMYKMAVAMIGTVARNRHELMLTPDDLALMSDFKKPGFTPTPEQSKRYDELKLQMQKIVKDMLELLVISKFVKPKLPTGTPRLDMTTPEGKKFLEDESTAIVDDIMNNMHRQFFGTLSPSSPIQFPVTFVVGFMSGFSKLGPTYETSGAINDTRTRTSDTQQGDPLRSNFEADMNLLTMGDPDVIETLKKEGVIRGSAPTLLR